MKKLIALCCLLSLCLPLFSCASSSIAPAEEAKTATAEEKKEETKKKENAKIVYPEGFSVGYARVDITPNEELPIYDGTASSTHDPLQLTVTAICDGKTAALMISVDLRGVRIGIVETCHRLIETSVGIPADRVLINATHTHSAPAPGFDDAADQWVSTVFYKKMISAVKEALLDLTPAEAYVGVSHTEGITFVRRYLKANGKYSTNPSSSDKPIAHESEADNEMRTIRFEREGKKDVLMVNYQTHYGDSPSRYAGQYSSDFVHTFREAAEKELDCLFAYHSGASGNINFNGKLPGEKKYGNFVEATEGLMLTAKDAIAKEEKAEVGGGIRSVSSKYVATTIQSTPERLAQAKEVNIARAAGKDYESLIHKYGFASKFEATAVIMRAGLGEHPEIPFTAISFGDIAFVSAPYEMFDTNGQEVRAASPFKATFICSLTNGSFGYLPSALAVPHGSYEVIITYFEYGSAERFAAEMVRLLNECKNAA